MPEWMPGASQGQWERGPRGWELQDEHSWLREAMGKE